MSEPTAPLTTGNTAHLYCLNRIEALIQERGEALRILDLGSGTSKDFVRLLERYPGVSYVGIEPDAADCATARDLLGGHKVTILNDFAYDMMGRLVDEPFDVIVSFSVLEHVYRRELFLKSAAACLKPDGVFLINYDAGHFLIPVTWRERVKNRVGPVLARLGMEQYYQEFVREQDFLGYVRAAGLTVAESKFFNSHLKGMHKAIPAEHRDEYMQRWLDFELWLNDLGIEYSDKHARTWFTRNFVLRLA